MNKTIIAILIITSIGCYEIKKDGIKLECEDTTNVDTVLVDSIPSNLIDSIKLIQDLTKNAELANGHLVAFKDTIKVAERKTSEFN